MEPKEESKFIKRGIIIFTVLVYALVITLHEIDFGITEPAFAKNLPVFHATLNGITFLCLVFSLISVKRKNINLHKSLNSLAMLLSLIFLLSYVLYHSLSGDTEYGGEMKGVYYFILATHIILAGLSLPFILFAYYYGYIGNVEKHKRIVKFTYPVWLYVALTGVVVYLFLAPYY